LSGRSWWDNRVSDQEGICFGKTACEKAHNYLLDHKNDVEGAKVIAATYCLDNFDECERNGKIEAAGDLALSLVAGLGAGGARAATASGGNVAKEAAEAIRLFGTASGLVKGSANVAAAEVLVEGRPSQILQSVSGKSIRDGMVPNAGDSGNPQRYNAIATGANGREYDTEIKILTYVANELGAPSSTVRGTINLHSERAVCISCSSVIEQFKSEFPGIRINVTTGG
jgi:hypothetical protein